MGLVLQGGGCLAAYEIGAINRLIEAGYRPTVASGTSMGAANAALIAGNTPEMAIQHLHAFWDDIARRRQPDSQFIYDSLMRLADFTLVREERISFAATACDIATGRFVVFSNSLMHVSPEHIVACATVPPQMMKIDGREYWGAGYVGGTALPAMGQLVEGQDIDDLPVFTIALQPVAEVVPGSPDEATERLLELSFQQSISVRLQADVAARMADEVHRSKFPRVKKPRLGGSSVIAYRWLKNLHQIPTPHEPLSGVFNYDRGLIRARFAAGYDAAGKFLHNFDPHPRPSLPPAAREIYTTVLSLGHELPDFEIVSIPSTDQTAVSRSASKRSAHIDTQMLVEAIAAALAAETDPRTARNVDLRRMAEAIVYETTVPIAESPLKSWTLAGLLGLAAPAIVYAGVGTLDPGHAPMIVLQTAGSFVVLGVAKVVRSAIDGFSNSAEEAGEAFGRKIFQRLGITSASPHATKSENSTPKARSAKPRGRSSAHRPKRRRGS
jgi:predicted acylesterase/phospholipase RssA